MDARTILDSISLDIKLPDTHNVMVPVEHVQYVKESLEILSKTTFFTENDKLEIVRSLCEHAENAKNIANGLRSLSETEKLTDNKILTHKSFNALCQHTMYTDKLLEALQVLQGQKLLNEDNFNILCQYAENATKIARVLTILAERKLVDNPENIKTFCQQVEKYYYDDVISALEILQNTSIQSTTNILTDDNFKTLCKNAKAAEKFATGLCLLALKKLYNPTNIEILSLHAEYAIDLALSLDDLQGKAILNMTDKKSLAKILLFLRGVGLNEHNDLADMQTSEDIYHEIIYSNDTKRFNNNIKIAAFFMAHQEILADRANPKTPNKPLDLATEEKINHFLSDLSNMQPEDLKNELKDILRKLGGYSFMPDEEKLTIGVEIEYSNIPTAYKQLTEFVMHFIQKGWSHPGDESVEPIGEDTYSGETTTPIIYSNTDLTSAMLNVAFLQAMKGETNASCGLHVHIGVSNLETPDNYMTPDEKKDEKAGTSPTFYTNYQLEFIKQFLMIYKREEAKFASIERNLNNYSESIIIPQNIQALQTCAELRAAINPEGRYYQVNLVSLYKHGTIEVRQFSGTTEESEIYATISMISAIAKEAQARTDQIFEARINQNPTSEEKTTDPPDIAETKGKNTLPPSFVAQQITERQTELFRLRVKSINESEVILTTKADLEKIAETKEAKNIVYVYLNDDGGITYVSYTKDNKKTPGTIENDERFSDIIDKMRQSPQSLSPQEKNQILYEVSIQAGAPSSHRVEKLRQINTRYNLFSNCRGGTQQPQTQDNDRTDPEAKAPRQ